MRRNFPFFLALGAGAALTTWIRQQVHAENAREWARLRGQRRTAGGPGTAFITGASSGIGEAFARELAHRGYNLVLLARREARLRSLADTLARDFSVQVDTLTADLSNPADLERAAARVAETPDLDLLVNNAGFGSIEPFIESDPQVDLRMIRVHVEASVRLTRAALPGMIARGFGGVINVSSLAGLIPSGGNHTYGATKSYLNFFSETLAYDLVGTGVRIQALCPGFTRTEFHDTTGRPVLPAFLWMKPEEIVAESLRGLREGRTLVVPGRFYSFVAALVSLLPFRLLARFAQLRGMQRRLLRFERPG